MCTALSVKRLKIKYPVSGKSKAINNPKTALLFKVYKLKNHRRKSIGDGLKYGVNIH